MMNLWSLCLYFIILWLISCAVHKDNKKEGEKKIDSILSEILKFVKIDADRKEVTKKIMEINGLTLKDTMIGFTDPGELPGKVVYMGDTLPLLLYVWYEGWEPGPYDDKIEHIEILFPDFIYYGIRIGDTIYYSGEIKIGINGAVAKESLVVSVKQVGTVSISETTKVMVDVGDWKVVAGEVYHELIRDSYVYVLSKEDEYGNKMYARYNLNKVGDNKFVVKSILISNY